MANKNLIYGTNTFLTDVDLHIWLADQNDLDEYETVCD